MVVTIRSVLVAAASGTITPSLLSTPASFLSGYLLVEMARFALRLVVIAS